MNRLAHALAFAALALTSAALLAVAGCVPERDGDDQAAAGPAHDRGPYDALIRHCLAPANLKLLSKWGLPGDFHTIALVGEQVKGFADNGTGWPADYRLPPDLGHYNIVRSVHQGDGKPLLVIGLSFFAPPPGVAPDCYHGKCELGVMPSINNYDSRAGIPSVDFTAVVVRGVDGVWSVKEWPTTYVDCDPADYDTAPPLDPLVWP